MHYNTVIFDLDGTLLNTIDDLCDSTNYALTTHGLPTRTIKEVTSFVGNGVKLLIERAVPTNTDSETINAVFSTFTSHYKQHMKDKTKPYEGILELLNCLKERGVKTAIVSNKFDEAVKKLKSEYFDDLILEAVGESPLVPKKPDPTSVLTALKILSSSADECLYVGDSDVDMITAKNASVTSVGVTWGFRSEECLLQNGADHIIHHPMDLMKLL